VLAGQASALVSELVPPLVSAQASETGVGAAGELIQHPVLIGV
jgi:hypothetical protein